MTICYSVPVLCMKSLSFRGITSDCISFDVITFVPRSVSDILRYITTHFFPFRVITSITVDIPCYNTNTYPPIKAVFLFFSFSN